MNSFLQPEDLIKILLALLVGGIIGIEREFRDKAAGFRTLIFICVGAALFTLLTTRLPGEKDATRMAAAVVSGVGFLGAGVILRQGFHITGLTTAATIWLTAALGVAIGAGEIALSLVASILALVVLEVFPWLERFLNWLRDVRKYEITCLPRFAKAQELLDVFRQTGLRAALSRQYKEGEQMILLIEASGSSLSHQRLLETLFADPEIFALNY